MCQLICDTDMTLNKLFLLAAAALGSLSASALGEYKSAPAGLGKMSYMTCPATADMRFPVIIVSYADVGLSDEYENVAERFDQKYNLEGFDWKDSPGSVRDYFIAASDGRFRPTFDFYGPVELSEERSYYGANTANYTDKKRGDMIIEAVEAMADEIDWSLYDSDSDGRVDDVIIVYAGDSEYLGGGSNANLPTSYLISYDKYNDSQYNMYGLKVGEYYVNQYTIINETAYGEYDGIGTFVHEFMHGLGLADVYSTYDSGAAYTPKYYDVMDVGIYNNGRLTPPTTSAFERYALGWMELEIIDSPCEIELLPLLDSNHAYIMPITDNEFYVLENRQQESWDEYLTGHGMLIWHIDYKASAWYSNIVNKDSEHQRIDLIEANGTISNDADVRAGYTFPGTEQVTSYEPMAWDGASLGLTITNISESADGIITAQVVDPAGISGIIADDQQEAQYYDLQGRPATPTAPGLYIKRTPARAQKLYIK